MHPSDIIDPNNWTGWTSLRVRDFRQGIKPSDPD